MVQDREPIRELEQVRHVTANYLYLQGLRFVPLSIYVLFSAVAGPHGLGVVPLQQADWLNLGFLVIVLLSTYAAHAYYQQNFGQVRMLPAASG